MFVAIEGNPVQRSGDHLRGLWARGEAAYGLWSSIPDLSVAELLARSPFDYTVVDLQHGAATFSELPGMIQAMRGGSRVPLVRVPWNEPAGIMRALDSGAVGVVAPMVGSADEARAAASACRFPPVGTRSWGPMWGYVRPDGALPPAMQDAAVLCLVMIETLGGLEALEEIVSVPGVDGVYIGPNDLALACGFGRGTYRDTPEIAELLQRIIDACRAAGIPAGLHCTDVEMARDWAARGATMLTVAHDTGLLQEAAAQAWARVQGVEAPRAQGAARKPY